MGQSNPSPQMTYTEQHDKIYDRRVAKPLRATIMFWWFPNMVAYNEASGHCLTFQLSLRPSFSVYIHIHNKSMYYYCKCTETVIFVLKSHCTFSFTTLCYPSSTSIDIKLKSSLCIVCYIFKAFKTYQKTLYLKALINICNYINGNHNTNCNS